MVVSGLVLIAAVVAILILLAIPALGIVAILVSGREDRWTVAAIVGVIGVVFLCCVVSIAAAILLYLTRMPM